MSLVHHNGYVIGSHSGAVFYEIKADTGAIVPARPFMEVPEPLLQVKKTPWAPWGANNLHPAILKCYLDNSGELRSIVKAKATFAINRGVLPVVGHYENNGEFIIDDVVDNDPEISDFIEESDLYTELYSLLKDHYGFGNFSGRFMLNKGRDKIARIRRDDIYEMRYKKMNDKNIIEAIMLCSEWERVKSTDDKRILEFPLVNYRNPQEDLRRIIDSNESIFEVAFTGRESDWGTKYYSNPDHYASRDWTNINIGVPKMKAAFYNNVLRPKYIIKIHVDFWQKFIFVDKESGQPKAYTYKEKLALRDAFFSDIDKYLAGMDNAYKSIFTEFFYDLSGGTPQKVQYIEIEAIEDKSIDGELLKDSSTSGSMIAFSMGWNPAINGGNLPSGPYTNSQGGSNVRESTLLQVMVAEPERKKMIRLLNIISRFNKWNEAHNGLKWIISSTIPTTLDTGGSSKPGVEGVPGEK
jgi:hypothetical protein